MANIYGIHPADKDLAFLTSLNKTLEERYSSYRYLRLEANTHTHEECLRTLLKDNEGLLFFFCHALEKSIRGCKLESEASSRSHNDFQYGPLISPTKDIEVFRGKSIFCLACHSRDIGEAALKAGAKVFLGFDDIPFFVTEKFKEERVEAAVKLELKTILQKVLVFSIDNGLTFNELSNLLILAFDRKRFELMLNADPGRALRLEVAKVLSRIKGGITIYGDGLQSLRVDED